MVHLKEGIFTDLHSANANGKIKVVVLHKPQIGNIWINLWTDKISSEMLEEANIAPPELISFRNYETYAKYIGSDEFNAMFEIVRFDY